MSQRRSPIPSDERGFVAIDLGERIGRVFLGRFGREQFDCDEIHRFANEPGKDGGVLRWRTRELLHEIKCGLALVAIRDPDVASLGVDTWGFDYGLLDGDGELIEEPVSYRDARTDGAFARVLPLVSREELYRATGTQLMPFNTLFQLHAHVHGGNWPRNVARLLAMPDLFHHELCGSDVAEATHASTTQMVRCDTRDWDRELLRRLGIPSSILPRIVAPGTRLGPLKADVAREVGLRECEVVAPGSHDAASAVAGTPLSEGVAYVSSGTWSLVGVELREPIVNDATLSENYTNEGGVEGSVRFQKNVTGTWILENCHQAWRERGVDLAADALETAIARAPAWAGVIAPDDPLFFNPADMPAAVRRFLSETQQPAPDDPGALARIVLESLALRYADVLETIARLTNRPLEALRILGDGSRQEFLNQATADVTGLEVLAGPVEATAIGNLLVQAIAAGRFADLAEARAYVAHYLPARRFAPHDSRGMRSVLARYRRMASTRRQPGLFA